MDNVQNNKIDQSVESIINSNMKLILKEDKIVDFKIKYVFLSGTLRAVCGWDDLNSIDELNSDNIPGIPIPCTEVDENSLRFIVKYLDWKSSPDYLELDENSKKNWLDEYFKMDDDNLFNIIMASNYLEYKDLLDDGCKKVADYIRECKTPQEIRRRFNIKNDFTPEEEEEVRKENSWCEE